MPYRKLSTSATWHWCFDCTGWPLDDFQQREDKPSTWTGQSLCEECATRDDCSDCRHSAELGTGVPGKLAQDVAENA